MEHKTTAQLMGKGKVSRILPREQSLKIIAEYFSARGTQCFKTIRDIEGISHGELQSQPVDNTIMEHAAIALREAGVTVGTTVGDVMRAGSLTHSDIHMLACYCHEHQMENSGISVATRARHLLIPLVVSSRTGAPPRLAMYGVMGIATTLIAWAVSFN